MTFVSGPSPWGAEHVPAGRSQSSIPQTGSSFEQALKYGADMDQRAYSFDELGMFGTHHALTMPSTVDVKAPSEDVVTPAASTAQAALKQASQKMDVMKADTAMAEPMPSSQGGDAGMHEAGAWSGRLPVSLGDKAGMDGAIVASAADIMGGIGKLKPNQAIPRAGQTPGEIEEPVAAHLPDMEGASAFVQELPTAQSTQSWLTLNIVDGRANLVLRDMDIDGQDVDALQAEIESALADHGLSLSTFTLNGNEAHVLKPAGKGA